MAGWKLKKGSITQQNISEEKIWSLFNFVFSDSSKKRNTYKYGFIKALLDNVFNGKITTKGVEYTYEDLFSRFTENYWNLVVKYDLRQMRKDRRSVYSKVELIMKAEVGDDALFRQLEFEAIDSRKKAVIIQKITADCKKYVIGALYEDFEGTAYSFDLKSDVIILSNCMYKFILKYKTELERLNYYSWARFLEKINDDSALIGIINKLELATPKRENLSQYKNILIQELKENTCFYCEKKLYKIHVDHFIPWSFVKDDKIWNLVLSCPSCNEKKNNRIPNKEYLTKIQIRNNKLRVLPNTVIQPEFDNYTDDLMRNIWNYAKLSGLKEYEIVSDKK